MPIIFFSLSLRFSGCKIISNLWLDQDYFLINFHFWIEFYFQTCGLWSRWLFDRFWSILDQFSSILDWFTSILDCFWLIIFYYFQTFGLWSRWWYQWRINFCFEIIQSRPISNLSQNWNSVFYQTSGRSWTRIWTLD